MKHFIIALTLIACSTVETHAQDKKVHFGFTLSPNFANTIVTAHDTVDQQLLNTITEREIGKITFGGNLFVEFNLSTKLILQLGLGYQNTGNATNTIALTSGNSIDPQLGFVTPNDGPMSVRFVYSNHQIEVPINLRYYPTKRLYGLFGLSGTVNVANTQRTILEFTNGETESNIDDEDILVGSFRRFGASVNAAIGYDVIQKEKLALFVQPYAQLGVFQLVQDAPINRRAISFGFSTGLRF